MIYALIENEKVSRQLDDIASWVTETKNEKELTPKELKRFLKVSKKLTKCREEFDVAVDSYWNRIAEEEEPEESRKWKKYLRK